MKRLLFFLILALSAHGQILPGILAGDSTSAPAAAPTLVGAPVGCWSGGFNCTPASLTTTAGNRGLVCVSSHDSAGASVLSVTASGAETYTLIAGPYHETFASGNPAVQACFLSSVLPGGAYTPKPTTNDNADFMNGVVAEIQGASSSDVNAGQKTEGTGAGGTAAGGTTGVTSQANELVFQFYSHNQTPVGFAYSITGSPTYTLDLQCWTGSTPACTDGSFALQHLTTVASGAQSGSITVGVLRNQIGGTVAIK